ncbi:MAG: RagB/SusD family nutrient uptake outer membrane protein [Segetibacter sp.]
MRLHDYLQLINMGGSYSFGAGGQAQAASLDTMASPTRTWETMINKNIGVDVVMLSSKLNFSFDYFIKRNEDMLVPVTYPSVLGAVAPSSNSGELKTWGFETSLGWKDKVGKLDYSVRVLLSDSKNKVVYYGGANTYVPGRNFVREGYPINTYFAYEFDGLIRTQKLDERTLVQLYGFQGYNTLTSEFQNRDPRMAMTFIVPGSNIFFEGGIMQPTYPGFTGSNATHTGYMIRKFLDETIDAATFRGQYDFKEFRYGEVLLILAEALYEQNNSISDQDLNRTINVVRSRVNMPALTNAFVTANGLNMLDEIRRERTVELAFEGFRRDDLRRWKLAETMMP